MALSKAFGDWALAKEHGWRRKAPAASRPKQFHIAFSDLTAFSMDAS
jgi:hypothetical protein